MSAGAHFGAIAAAGTTGFLPFSAPGLASLDVTTLADGLARFLADRTKKELHVAFFRRFQKVIEDNRHKELGILFPNTVINLGGAGDNVWKFDNYIETLREGFYQDLNALPGNLVFLATELDQARNQSELIRLLKNNVYNTNPFLRPAIANTYAIAKMTFSEHAPLADVISSLGTMNWDTLQYSSHTKLEDIFRISAFFSDCLLRTPADRVPDAGDWITMRDFTRLRRDPVLLQVFMALVYQQARNIELSGEIRIDSSPQTLKATSMRAFLASQKDKLMNAREALGRICARVNGIQEAALALKPDAAGSTASRDNSVDMAHIQGYLTIADNIVYLLEDGLQLAGVTLEKNERTGIDCFRRVISIYTDVTTKSYALAISKTFSLIDTLAGSNNGLAQFKEGDFYRYFVTFGTFMASVVRAESSEDVQAAIESVAMPVGSASVKKYSRFNVALNAYVGGFYGGERLTLPQQGSRDKPLLATSATIGVSAGWGFGKGGSLSLFGSLLDLGALVAFRLKDSSTADLPKLELRNIIAPGGYLVYGFPKIPISLGFGAQWGPALREVTVSGNTLSETPGWRWGGFVAVDIPVLNFYSSRNWKRK